MRELIGEMEKQNQKDSLRIEEKSSLFFVETSEGSNSFRVRKARSNEFELKKGELCSKSFVSKAAKNLKVGVLYKNGKLFSNFNLEWKSFEFPNKKDLFMKTPAIILLGEIMAGVFFAYKNVLETTSNEDSPT